MTSIKNITELKDKTVRHNLIQRYLEVETSLEEEHLLTEFYRHAKDDELTNEDRTIRTILLGTTDKEDLTLSDSAVAEFDRIMAGIQPQKMSKKQVKQPQHTAKSIRISAILLAAAMIAGLIFLILPQKQQKKFSNLHSACLQDHLPEHRGRPNKSRGMGKGRLHIPCQRAISNKPKSYKQKENNHTPQYNQEEMVLTEKTTKDFKEETVKESVPQQETSEPNVLELFDKCNEIASLLHPTTELIGMEYDGNNSILTITDENGATYQYKIQTDKGNGKDYQLFPLASITPTDYTHY